MNDYQDGAGNPKAAKSTEDIIEVSDLFKDLGLAACNIAFIPLAWFSIFPEVAINVLGARYTLLLWPAAIVCLIAVVYVRTAPEVGPISQMCKTLFFFGVIACSVIAVPFFFVVLLGIVGGGMGFIQIAFPFLAIAGFVLWYFSAG